MDFIIDNFDKLFDSEENFKKLEEIILDLAVKGKLVPQNPDDEPASVLLDKIKAEKEKLIKEKKIKKDKDLEPISEEEKPFEIPDSWEWVRLGTIIELLSGQDISVNKCNSDKIGIPYIMGASNIQNEEIIIERWIEKPKVIGLENDILLSCKGTVGKTIIQNIPEAHLSRQIMGIRKMAQLDNKYLKLYIDSAIITIRDKAQGLIPGISREDILNLYFPLPPLAEQKRIVEKVDSLKKLIDTLKEKAKIRDKTREELKKSIMAEIEKSDSNIDLLNSLEMVFKNFDTIAKNKEDIKDIRDLILSMAVKGKLVPQNVDDEPASVLLEKIKAEKEKLIKEKKIKKDKELEPISEEEKPFEIPDSWKWVRLGEITEIFSGNAFESSDFNNQSGAKTIKITNVGVNQFVETNEFLPLDYIEKYKEFCIFENDILIALTRPYIKDGLKVCLCSKEYNNSLLNQRVATIKTETEIYKLYIFLYLKTELVLNAFKAKFERQGLQPNLRVRDLTDLLFPLPPLAEQKRIVEKVDKLMALCDDLEKKVEKSQKEFEKILESAIKEVTANNAN